MSRIIKFRAWDIVRQIMFRPTFIELSDGDIAPGGVWQGLPGATGYGYNAELMQFTGLLDKNGREIYEGDIIRVPEGVLPKEIPACEVEWHPQGYFNLKGIHCFTLLMSAYEQLEVIGNIYENPELLKEA